MSATFAFRWSYLARTVAAGPLLMGWRCDDRHDSGLAHTPEPEELKAPERRPSWDGSDLPWETSPDQRDCHDHHCDCQSGRWKLAGRAEQDSSGADHDAIRSRHGLHTATLYGCRGGNQRGV